MEKPTGRFNLRTRKSLKLAGQIECNSCKRNYFPSNFSDDNDNTEQTENVCCNCEKIPLQNAPQPRKRAKRTSIKEEKIDPDFDFHKMVNVSNDQCPGTSETTKIQLPKQSMVQIHSIELLKWNRKSFLSNSF